MAEQDGHQQAADLFQLLSHPARLQILDELRRRQACVCHLEAVLGQSQPYISQQLRLLREGGVVTSQREGLYVYYRVADRQVQHLLEEVLGPAQKHTEPEVCPCPRCEDGAAG